VSCGAVRGFLRAGGWRGCLCGGVGLGFAMSVGRVAWALEASLQGAAGRGGGIRWARIVGTRGEALLRFY